MKKRLTRQWPRQFQSSVNSFGPILSDSWGCLKRNIRRRIVLKLKLWKEEERACCNSLSSMKPLRSLSTIWKLLITSWFVPGGKFEYPDEEEGGYPDEDGGYPDEETCEGG